MSAVPLKFIQDKSVTSSPLDLIQWDATGDLAYTPNDAGDWVVPPTGALEGLDELAQRVTDGANVSAVPATFMFTDTASDIATYKKMELLANFVAGALATVTAAVTTSETLIEEFATIAGQPGFTSLPVGLFLAHYESDKDAGVNAYYTRFKVYKRDISNVETLIATSDNSSQSISNSILQNTISAFITTEIPLLLTDRIVVKIYGVMVSGTANITINYDSNTNSRFQLPVVSLGYIPENKGNKATDLSSPDDIKYPSTLAVQNGLDLKIGVTESIVNALIFG